MSTSTERCHSPASHAKAQPAPSPWDAPPDFFAGLSSWESAAKFFSSQISPQFCTLLLLSITLALKIVEIISLHAHNGEVTALMLVVCVPLWALCFALAVAAVWTEIGLLLDEGEQQQQKKKTAACGFVDCDTKKSSGREGCISGHERGCKVVDQEGADEWVCPFLNAKGVDRDEAILVGASSSDSNEQEEDWVCIDDEGKEELEWQRKTR